MAIIPKVFRLRTAGGETGVIRVSPRLIEAASQPASAVMEQLQSGVRGLSAETTEQRLEKYGPNTVAQEKHRTWLGLLEHALVNPLVVLLMVLATVAFLTGDPEAGLVMSVMIVLGVVLQFIQESRADAAAARLTAMISVTATVIRDGQPREIPLRELVPGDLVKLSSGDMIPADVRIITSRDLFVIQASLTGESLPVEKTEPPMNAVPRSALELTNVC